MATVRVSLSSDDAAMVLQALSDFGVATPDADALAASVELAGRIRHASARVFGAEWAEEH